MKVVRPNTEVLYIWGDDRKRGFREELVGGIKMEWTFATERLPEDGDDVLLYYKRNAWNKRGDCIKKKEMGVGWQINGLWHVDGCSGVEALAWMKLPKPPKGARNDKKRSKRSIH